MNSQITFSEIVENWTKMSPLKVSKMVSEFIISKNMSEIFDQKYYTPRNCLDLTQGIKTKDIEAIIKGFALTFRYYPARLDNKNDTVVLEKDYESLNTIEKLEALLLTLKTKGYNDDNSKIKVESGVLYVERYKFVSTLEHIRNSLIDNRVLFESSVRDGNELRSVIFALYDKLTYSHFVGEK